MRSTQLAVIPAPVDPLVFQPFGESLIVDAPVRTLLVLSMTCVVAWVSFQLLERPFLNLKTFFGEESAKQQTSQLVLAEQGLASSAKA